MRNISFALTTGQIRARTKTVTRRCGWLWLVEHFMLPSPPEILLQPIVKGQGIPKGGHVEKIGGPIRVIDARCERLNRLSQSPDYGTSEMIAEGFPEYTQRPAEWVAWFCKCNSCLPDFIVTRIQFEYV